MVWVTNRPRIRHSRQWPPSLTKVSTWDVPFPTAPEDPLRLRPSANQLVPHPYPQYLEPGQTTERELSLQDQFANGFFQFLRQFRHQPVGQCQVLDGVQSPFSAAVFHLHSAGAALRGAEKDPWAAQLLQHRSARLEGDRVVFPV